MSALAVLITIIVAPLTSGQTAHVRTITIDDGLPSSEVHDVAQGADGRIWLATRSGLSVFDGVSWSTVPPPSPLSETASTFSEVALDQQGRVWVASPHSTIPLFIYDGSGWSRSAPYWSSLDDPVIITALSVLDLPERTYAAVGTPDRALAIWTGGQWRAVGPAQGLNDPEVRAVVPWDDRWVVATASGIYWVTVEGIVTSWNTQLADPIMAMAPLPTANVNPASATVRVLTEQQIADVTFDTGAIQVLVDDLDFHGLHGSMVVMGDGTTVAADHSTVVEVPTSSRPVRLLDVSSGLVGTGALSLFVDRQENLWIAGRRGATVVMSRRFATYRADQGLLENEVTAIGELDGVGLVFGHNAGVTVLGPRELTTIPIVLGDDARNLTSRVLTIIESPDAQNSVWIAASNAGLLRLDHDLTLHQLTAPGVVVNTAAFDADGTLWWAGRRVWRQRSDGRFEQITSQGHQVVRRLLPQADGTMLVLTIRGLFQLGTDDRLVEIPTPDIPGAWSTYCAYHKGDTTLVGTSAGVLQLQQSRLERPQPPLAGLDRPVFTIVEAPDGTLWFGTDDGVFIADAASESQNPLRHLTTHSGLAGREVNRDALFVDRQNRLWIGTDSGVSRYNPEYDRVTALPEVTLRSTDVDGRLIDADEPMSLPATANTVIFRFLATSVADWGAVRCRVRLEGYDEAWSDPLPNSQRWVRYTNLPPGRYRFQVQARGSAGRWTQPVHSAWLTIRGPISQRWWFIPMLLLALTTVVGLVTVAGTRWRYARQLEREIAERRSAQSALAVSQASFAGIVDQNTEGILVTDHNARIVFANPSATSLLAGNGSTDTDIIGTVLEPQPKPDHRPVHHEVIGTDDTRRALELSGRSIDWHGQPSVLVIVRDVTDRISTERALRRSEERFRNLFERNLAGVFRSTTSGQILECNLAFARIYGYDSVADAVSTPAVEFYPSPREREALMQRLEAAGGRLVNVRRQGRRRDGTAIEILENVALVADEYGQYTRLEGTLFDVTDLRKLEEQLFHAQKMEAIGRLAGGVAHDFNNVLQAFQGISEQLRAEGHSVAEREAQLDELDALVTRGASLTRQLLLFSRKETTNTEPLDLADVVHSSCAFLRRLLPERVTLDVQIGNTPITVRGDRGQLEQVLVNLAVNAADAMSTAGVITIRARLVNGGAILEVIDTGCGISDDALELVFEPFFTTKSLGEGTGLGLAVVDGIVRLHNGTINLSSCVGEGTTVTVTLPHCSEPPRPATRPRAPSSGDDSGDRPVVLIVEDDDGARVAFARLLDKLGFEPLPAASLGAARQILDTTPVELVLTDLLLPDGHGGELVAELADRWPDLPIVCMSGYPDQPLPNLAQVRQPQLLLKPFTSSTLAAALTAALESNREQL